MSGKNRQLSISFNSPVVLIFSLICLISLGLGVLTGGRTTTLFFSVYRSSLSDPLTYVRFIGHVFGHAGWDHLISNLMLLLIVGPMLEEKYGSVNLLFVILITAIVTGVVNFVFFPNIRLLGAQRRCFCFYSAVLFRQYARRKHSDDVSSGCDNLYRRSALRWNFCTG